jgi:hypothetical protein
MKMSSKKFLIAEKNSNFSVHKPEDQRNVMPKAEIPLDKIPFQTSFGHPKPGASA